MAITDAFQSGVDFISVELYLSKDGEIVIFHDKSLNKLTNVSDLAEFADKKNSKGFWLTNYFTLAELKKLRLR